MTTTAERPAAPAASDELTRSINPYDARTNAENFDLHSWLATFDQELLNTPEGRRTLTRLDPLLFAIVYLAKHLKDTEGKITFSDAHFLWIRLARRWIGPSRGQKQDRRALVAPRSCGKSTWFFLILPMWAGAHGHARFAAAFADSGAQAELHLATFKRELSDNTLLRRDFPDYCEPARRHNGKALALDTELLTGNHGWTTMAHVRPGDHVYHPDGHTVEVSEVMDVQHGRPCYRVSTTDERSIVADADHLWTVLDKRKKVKGVPQPRVVTTREMVEDGWWRDSRQREGRYVLPEQQPLKTPDIYLPIDPYLFGAWLGDGHSWGAQLVSHVDDVSHWVAEIERCGFVPSVSLDKAGSKARRIGMTSPGVGGLGRSMRGRLDRLGVLANKRVPNLYLTAGTSQREALVQGLMDTDGFISKGQGQVEYCSTRRNLADAALYLVRSLGWKATLREARSTIKGVDCGPKYRIMFTPKAEDAFCPFRMERKRALVRAAHVGRATALNTVSIWNIEPVESVPVRCIRVDSPDGLFLAGRDLVPTHNTINDSQQMLYTKTGFAFAARGIDSTSLGMKVDEVRPDLLIFDDIEPPEATYSTFQRDKRLSTVQNAILPLNESARVILVGTVTMPGSIVHSLVRDAKGEETELWIEDERFRTFHTRPIIRRDDGTERSVWPAKWSIDYLNSIRKTRSFKLNYDNDPRGRTGEYWNEEDIKYGVPPNITRLYLMVDPPVTQKRGSDPCGLAIVGYAPAAMRQLPGHSDVLSESEADITKPARLSRAVIMDAWQVPLTGKPLRRHILQTLNQWPNIQAVILESNQGGDLWLDVMENLPVKFMTFGSYESKEVRFARALDFYQKRRVTHAKVIPALEDQLTGFPRTQHDDIADATCCGVLRLLKPKPVKKNTTVRQR
jgi:hypothetical protein